MGEIAEGVESTAGGSDRAGVVENGWEREDEEKGEEEWGENRREASERGRAWWEGRKLYCDGAEGREKTSAPLVGKRSGRSRRKRLV